MNKNNGKTQKLSKEDWITSAFTTLSESGVNAVRVEALAKRMGVTKGSFYWHFKSRQELLEAILEKWHKDQRVIKKVENIGGTPKEKLINLLESVPRSTQRNNSGATELAVRSWARNDTLAAETIAIVDKERIDWVKGYFIELGYDESVAESRAFLTYGYIMAQGIFSIENMQGILERIHDDIIKVIFSK
ncbi:MAG: TetR/AcrR family transcriptional regulator [Rhizobiales bacterium]|nr:TetR/AcrR family transcriptional regulator [Hyphomicrobiales bacterium]